MFFDQTVGRAAPHQAPCLCAVCLKEFSGSLSLVLYASQFLGRGFKCSCCVGLWIATVVQSPVHRFWEVFYRWQCTHVSGDQQWAKFIFVASGTGKCFFDIVSRTELGVEFIFGTHQGSKSVNGVPQ